MGSRTRTGILPPLLFVIFVILMMFIIVIIPNTIEQVLTDNHVKVLCVMIVIYHYRMA